MNMHQIMKKIRAAAFAAAAFGASVASIAGDLCEGSFPNLITEVCWSCTFPIKLFGKPALQNAGGEDYDSSSKALCACKSPPKIGVPTGFWEMNQMTDVTATPGCFPMLGGARVNVGVNADAYGYVGDTDASGQNKMRESFRQVNLYINPAMYIMGAALDNSCMDNRGIDVPWVSFADPTHNDEELANILTPYAFPFGSLVAIGAGTVDSIAASAGFPIPEIFWFAGSFGSMYPLTGTNQAHLSNEQSARLQTTRVLAKLHAAGTQWTAAGDDAMCSYYPQIIMDKRQYKLQRLYPRPQTTKINGKCCDPIGRTTVLTESGTEAPLSSFRDFGYAIFRKRDCCAGVYP